LAIEKNMTEMNGMNKIKLHVGCASKRLEGYINIDSRQTDATDHVCDAGAITIVSAGTVSEIYARHMLEHLDPNDAIRTLKHWHDLLAPTGFLQVIVPDITFHAQQLLGLTRSSMEDQNLHALAGFWGWRDETRGGSKEDAHRWGYTEKSLVQILLDLGFTDVHRVAEGVDSEPWHLNVIAR
jgi:predicted SAM-dependent methyltransferase